MSIFLPCVLIVVVNCPSPHDVVLVHGHRHHVHVVISGRSRGYIVCNAYYALNCVSFIGIPVWSISYGGPALPGLVQPKNLHSVCIASMNYKPAPVGFLKCYYACSTVLKAKNMTFHITIDKEEHYVGIIVESCVICVEPLVEMRCEELWISPSVHSSNHINAALDLIRYSTKSKKSSLVNGQPHLNIFMITYGWRMADWSWVPSPPVYCIAPWCLALLRHVLR